MKRIVGSFLALTLLVSPGLASAANSHDDALVIAKKGDSGKSSSGSSKSNNGKTTTKSEPTNDTKAVDEDVVAGKKNMEETKAQFKQEKKKLLEEFKNNKKELKARAKAMRQQLEATIESGEEKAELLETTAELLEEAGDLDEAIHTQEEAVQEELNNVDRYKKLAKLMEKKGNKGVKAFVNGKHPKFDVPPVIKSGRTLVPIRAISEALGAEVTWNQEEKTALIVRDGVEIKLVLNEVKAYVDGKEIVLDVPSTSINSRIVVPLRFISEAFDAAVKWEDETDSVIIVDDNAGAVEQDGTATDEATTDETVGEDGITEETPAGEIVEEDTTTDEAQGETVTDETTTGETVPTDNATEPII